MDQILNKLQEITNEMAELANAREYHKRQVHEIEIRMTQLAGAIEALEDVQKRLTADPVNQDSTPQSSPEAPLSSRL